MIIATGSDCVFKISILEFWNEYKVELLICFFMLGLFSVK